MKLIPLSLLCLFFCGCGGSPKAQMMATPATAEAGMARAPADVRAEIERLHSQITELRQGAGMPAEPSAENVCAEVESTDAVPMGAQTGETSPPDLRKDECEAPPAASECSDACELRAAICDNANSICRLAQDLAGDAWAAEKCQSARASCQEAQEYCCGCTQAG
jgi:hypothetical protein